MYRRCVRLVFDRLEKRMGTYEFASIFEYLLTDRGSEFGDPEALETGVKGIHTNEPWKVLEYCSSLGEIYDIVVEDMDRQARGLKG